MPAVVAGGGISPHAKRAAGAVQTLSGQSDELGRADQWGHAEGAAIIDWIEDAGKVYGIAARRLMLGGYWYSAGDAERFHFDGSAARSISAKLAEDREGAAGGEISQRFAEVLTGEALEFRTATRGCPIWWHELIVYRYVIPNRWMPPKSKLAELRSLYPRRFKSRETYYDELHGLHCYALGKWPGVPRGADGGHTVATMC